MEALTDALRRARCARSPRRARDRRRPAPTGGGAARAQQAGNPVGRLAGHRLERGVDARVVGLGVGAAGMKVTARGRSIRLGGAPPIGASSLLARPVERGDRVQQAPRVGVFGVRRTARSAGARSTIRPAYMTATSSAISATTPRSWVMITIAIPSSAAGAPAARGSAPARSRPARVVGSSAISSLGSLASAIAIIARWRIPPENSCG